MKIELKNIKFSERMSEETNCFDAFLYVNNKKAAHVYNQGHGGCTNYQAIDIESISIVKSAEEYAKTLPDIDLGEGITIESNLESFIDNLFDLWLSEQDKKKFEKKLLNNMKKGICYGTSTSYNIISWKGYKIEDLVKLTQGEDVIKKAIKKIQSENKEILNTNLPKELFN